MLMGRSRSVGASTKARTSLCRWEADSMQDENPGLGGGRLEGSGVEILALLA